jgi:hypothetical protein
VLGLAAIAAPLAGVAALLLGPSPDVPYIDDYDTIAAFLLLYDDTPSASGALRHLVEHHNEHLMALPRAAGLMVRGLRGQLDFRLLNALGAGWLLLLLLGLYLAFRRGESALDKLLPFAPAALLLLHPQFHMIYRSPTTSHSSFAVPACAALAFVALDRGGARRLACAALLSLAAMATLANGILIAPLGLVVPGLQRRWKQGAAWALVVAALLVFYFVVLDPPGSSSDPLQTLAQPERVLRYALNFVGCAAGFSRPGWSMLAGGLVLVALVGAIGRGLPRRSPALFAMVLFLLGSAAANTLGRAPQGPGLALLQPRYTFYGSLFLALTYLSWAEVAPHARRAFAASLLASAAFWAVSFHLYRDRVALLSTQLAEGYERWWVQGGSGLAHPDFRSAEATVLHGLAAGWLRLPPEWLERHAAWPIPRDPPRADSAVQFALDLVGQDEHSFYVSGWARAGASSRGQEVELVLRGRERSYVFPAVTVARADLDREKPGQLRGLAESGFRVLVSKQALAPGRYRLGVLVRRGGHEHLSYQQRPVEVRPAGQR